MKSEYNLADLRNSGAPQKEIEKQQAKVRNFASEFTKARADYNRRYPSERYVSNTRAELKKLKMMKSQKHLMREKESNQSINKMKLKDHVFSQIGANQKTKKILLKSGERQKKRLETNQATFTKNEKVNKELLERLGIKNSVLEQEREVFQQDKADLDMLIEVIKKLSVI